MKNIKLIFTIIILIAVLTASTLSLAYDGTDVDTYYEITMPASLTSGIGTVTSSKDGTFKYQFVETTQAKYEKLKKLSVELELVKAYIVAENANWEDANANTNYEALVEKYETEYMPDGGNGNTGTVASLFEKYGVFDDNTVSTIRSLWIHELPNFEESNWISGTNNQISLDTSKFTGTKYYIAWVQLGDMYDAEAYIVSGTKTDKDPDENKTPDDNTTPDDGNKTPDDNTTPDDGNKTPDDNTTPDDGNKTPDDNTIPDDGNKTPDNGNKTPNGTDNDKTNSSGKKDTSGDKTIKPIETLPYTGVVVNMLIYVGIALSIISAIISYKKFKNIK